MKVESAILRVTDITRPLGFDPARPLEVEVGCGKGKFLVSRAAANPDCDLGSRRSTRSTTSCRRTA